MSFTIFDLSRLSVDIAEYFGIMMVYEVEKLKRIN